MVVHVCMFGWSARRLLSRCDCVWFGMVVGWLGAFVYNACVRSARKIYFIFNQLRANLWHFCGCARIHINATLFITFDSCLFWFLKCCCFNLFHFISFVVTLYMNVIYIFNLFCFFFKYFGPVDLVYARYYVLFFLVHWSSSWCFVSFKFVMSHNFFYITFIQSCREKNKREMLNLNLMRRSKQMRIEKRK